MSMCCRPSLLMSHNSKVMAAVAGPGGVLHSCLNSISSSQPLSKWEFSLYVGTHTLASVQFSFKSDNLAIKFEPKILWHFMGNQVCLILEGKFVVFLMIDYHIIDGKRITLSEALERFEPDHTFSDLVSVSFSSKTKVFENLSPTGSTVAMSRYILLGTHAGEIIKVDWNGDVLCVIGSPISYSLVSSTGASKLEWECQAQPNENLSVSISGVEEAATSIKHSGSHDTVYVDNWSELNRCSIIRYLNGSISILFNLGTQHLQSPRWYPVMSLKQSQYADLSHPNRNAYGKTFYSLVMNTEEIEQHQEKYFTQLSSDSVSTQNNKSHLHSAKLNNKIDHRITTLLAKPADIISKVLDAITIDSPIVCDTGSLLLVCLVDTPHFPAESHIYRNPFQPNNTRSNISFETGFSGDHTLSLVQYKLTFLAANNQYSSISGSPVAIGVSPILIETKSTTDNFAPISIECLSISPFKEFTALSSNSSQYITSDSQSAQLGVLHVGDSVNLILSVDGFISSRSLTGNQSSNNLYFVIDTSIVSPLDELSSRVGSFFFTTVSSIIFISNYLSDENIHQSTIHRLELSALLNDATSCQSRGIIFSASEPPSLFVHYLSPPLLHYSKQSKSKDEDSPRWEDTYFEADTMDSVITPSDISLQPSRQQIIETVGDFLEIRLPYRLCKDVMNYHTHLGTVGRFRPGTSIPLTHTGVFVAKSTDTDFFSLDYVTPIASESDNSCANHPLYVAVAVGSRLQNLVSVSVSGENGRSLTIWLHNCYTKRWREIHLDVGADSKNDKTIQVISELRQDDFMLSTCQRVVVSSREEPLYGMNGTLYGSLSSVSGPVQSINGLAWYGDHSIITITMRRSRYCLEVCSRAATKNSLQIGKTRSTVHKIYPLEIGFCPRYMDVVELPNALNLNNGLLGLESSGHIYDSVDSATRQTRDNTTPTKSVPIRRYSQTSNSTSVTSSSNIYSQWQQVQPSSNRLAIIIGDGMAFSAFHVQAFCETAMHSSLHESLLRSSFQTPSSPKSTITSNKVSAPVTSSGTRKNEVKNYDMCQFWEVDLKQTTLLSHSLPVHLSSYETETMSRPFKKVLAVPVHHYCSLWLHPHRAQSSGNVLRTTPRHIMGDISTSSLFIDELNKIDLCMFILDNAGFVWCIEPLSDRIVLVCTDTVADIEMVPCRNLVAALNRESSMNDNDSIGGRMIPLSQSTIDLLGAVILHSHSTVAISKASKLWLPATLAKLSTDSSNRKKHLLTVSVKIIPLTTLSVDETPIGVTKSTISLSQRTRLNITPVLFHDQIDSATSTKSTENYNRKSIQNSILSPPTGNYAIIPHCLHTQIFQELFQILVTYIVTNGRMASSSLNNKVAVNYQLILAKECIQGILFTVDRSPISLAMFTHHLELYCKDLVYDMCATRVTGPSYTKSGVEFRLITSLLYKYKRQLFFEVVGLLGRKLEPDISTRLFPLYLIYDLDDLLSRDLSNQLIFTPLDLFEKCMVSGDLFHASRLLTLACDFVGGSENVITLCNSIILSMELLLESIKVGLYPLALECIDFCHRLEEMLLCLCTDPQEVYEGLVFSNDSSDLSHGSLLIKMDYSTKSAGGNLTTTSESSNARLQNNAILTRSIAFPSPDNMSIGLTTGIFSALAFVSPAVSYYLGGGLIWALSRTIGALMPQNFPRHSETLASQIESSANFKEGPESKHQYHAFASVLLSTFPPDSEIENEFISLENPSDQLQSKFSVWLLSLVCQDMITNRQYGVATILMMLIGELPSSLRENVLWKVDFGEIDKTNCISTIAAKHFSIHRLVLETTLKEKISEKLTKDWLEDIHYSEVQPRGSIRDDGMGGVGSWKMSSRNSLSSLQTVSGHTYSGSIDGHLNIEIPSVILSRNSHGDVTGTARVNSKETRSMSATDNEIDEDLDSQHHNSSPANGTFGYFFANFCILMALNDSTELAATWLVVLFKQYELAARLVVSSKLMKQQRKFEGQMLYESKARNSNNPVVKFRYSALLDLFKWVWNDQSSNVTTNTPIEITQQYEGENRIDEVFHTTRASVLQFSESFYRIRATNEYSTMQVTARKVEAMIKEYLQ